MATLKELVQGKPLRHPTHPMLVHFPAAFYLGTLSFDIMSRISPSPGLVLAGTYLLVGALAATAGAVVTGLVDWWDMVRGSTKRRRATVHMLVQLAATAFFVALLALRWGGRGQGRAEISWIAVGAVGYLVFIVGNYLGGLLVYHYAMRVRTGEGEKPSREPGTAA